MGAVRGRRMIPFEKTAGRWKGGGFLSEPDYEFADCERSVALVPSWSGRCEDLERWKAVLLAQRGRPTDTHPRGSGPQEPGGSPSHPLDA
jgi:hypothetical protein